MSPEDPKKKNADEGVEAKASPKKGKGKLKLIVMILGLVVLMGGGVAGGVLWGMKHGKPGGPKAPGDTSEELAADAEGGEAAEGEGDKEGEKEGDKKGEGKEEGEAAAADAATGKPSLMYKMDKVMVNLTDLNGRMLIHAGILVEAESAKARTVIEENVPPLQDALITLLSSKSVEDIRMGAGKERFKRELMARFNELLPPDTVKNIWLDQWTFAKQP